MTKEAKKKYKHDWYIANKNNPKYKERVRNNKRRWQENNREYVRENTREYHRQHYKMFAYVIPGEETQIENYELAKKDNFDGWCIHHRLELIETGGVVDCTAQDLKDWNIYFNRPANELIFMKNEEHARLHALNQIGIDSTGWTN